MTVEGCPKVAKYILVGFNVLVLIAGGLAIGLGAWTLASDYGGEKLQEITGSSLYRGASIAIIVGGCIIVALAFLGCCGSVMESRIMLGIYFVVMLLFLILFVVAAVLGFVYKDDLKSELAKQMENTLENKYGVDISNSQDNSATTDVWNDIQKNTVENTGQGTRHQDPHAAEEDPDQFKCCGVEGGLNSVKSWYLWQSSAWYKNQSGITQNNRNLVPASCCNAAFNLNQCQKVNQTTTSQPVQTYSNVTVENPALYSTGCIDKMINEIENHIGAIAGIALAVLVVLLLSVIFSVCVCTSIGQGSMIV